MERIEACVAYWRNMENRTTQYTTYRFDEINDLLEEGWKIKDIVSLGSTSSRTQGGTSTAIVVLEKK